MAKSYDYVLAVWLRLKTACAAADMLVELQECLEDEYCIIKLEVVEEPESAVEGELAFSLSLQVNFDESRMDGIDPTQQAIRELEDELRAYLESKYEVTHLDMLDDALTSYLLAEHDEPEPRKYPKRKQRDLTDEEKSQLRARIERGNADIYALATEFGCSASQVAGIKAAMHR